MKPDKGNGVVILNKSEYISKMNLIINDKTKFKSINKDIFKFVIMLEDKTTRLFRSFKKQKHHK